MTLGYIQISQNLKTKFIVFELKVHPMKKWQLISISGSAVSLLRRWESVTIVSLFSTIEFILDPQ